MGNFLSDNVVLVYKFFSFFSDFTVLVYGSLSLLLLAVFALLLPIAHKKVKSKFPVKVNCWFCNNNTTVPYELSNGWDCPDCEQYNGFSKDGDYNKIIPEQYNHKLNEGIFNILRTSVKSKDDMSHSNGLCKLCNINQQLKIQQLALFVPINENKYFEEIEQYREKLEKAYHLCSKCEKTLQETLEKQEYNLLQNRLNSHKHSVSSQSPERLTKIGGDDILVLIKKKGVFGLKLIHIIFSLLLFLALIIHFETENHFLKLSLPHIEILEFLLPVLEVLFHYKDKIYDFKKELTFAGLLSCFLVQFENKVKNSHMVLLAWGLLHISLWTSFTGLHVLLSGICLIFNFQTAQRKFIELNKKSLPKKSGFQPVKTVFPGFQNYLRQDKSVNGISLKSDSFTSLSEDIDLMEDKKKSKRESKPNLMNMPNSEEKRKKARLKEEEVESSFPNEGKEKKESQTLNSTPNSPFISKSIISSPDADKNFREINGSISEVYNTLNSLQIGGKQTKSNRPPNFLFANHNFSEPKNSSSIIKPAKFIKNLNSSSWTESNECNSRSSTPSSGYSSQKPEKIEPNRYDFPKTITPVSVNSFNRHSPNHCFDYCDGNHGFYNAMNCFSPGFVPFQQFPGSMGHTTIYTCTRPTNFFPFSPWQGFPGPKFSPSSTRFSDCSDHENLFQESSKRFEKNQRRLKLKTFFYYCSIFLNFVTVMGLVYFTSAGIISVDWKLPKFDFFV